MPLGEFQEDLYVGDSLPLNGASSTLEVGHDAASLAQGASGQTDSWF
jgi:hypothetical protein